MHILKEMPQYCRKKGLASVYHFHIPAQTPPAEKTPKVGQCFLSYSLTPCCVNEHNQESLEKHEQYVVVNIANVSQQSVSKRMTNAS